MMRAFDELWAPYRYVTLLATAMCAWVGIGIIRLLDPASGSTTLAQHGVLDEIGHVLTALMIAVGLKALRLPIPIWSVLIGGMVLDVGHILTMQGITDPIGSSTRNGTHSVFALILLAIVGFVDQRRANVWLGITLGALTHLWRDMGTGTVPLLWPLLENVDGTTFKRYMIGLLGASIAMIGSGALLELHEHATARDGDSADA